MVSRTIDLSGRYQIDSLAAHSITLVDPASVNPAWDYVDLDGGGTTGYSQTISVTLVKAPPVNLAGTYEIDTVTADTITLVDAAGVNADWGSLPLYPSGRTALLSPSIATTAPGWIGPFVVDDPQTSLLVANFVAEQGLFKDSGKKQTAFPITIELEATPIDSAGDPVGPAQTFSVTVEGNAKGRDFRAATLVCELDVPGRQSVRAHRTTPADYSFQGTVVDEVKWQDLFGIADTGVSDFGNVTTVHSRTFATTGALNVKERRLNMLVTRKVPLVPSGTLTATNSADDIFLAMALDPYIGARSIEELDVAGIREAVQAAKDYFGAVEAGEFNYTFDDDKTSFEEMASIIAQAVFSTPFRQGSLIGLAFERATDDSTLLFNHRNKVPGSETRTVRFGVLDDNDGVEVQFADPDNKDLPSTIYIPARRTAVNPRQIKLSGVRARTQAYWQAWRVWNRMRAQNVTVEFHALQEAATLGRNERVLVADNTRPDTQDGEVVNQVALSLELSEAVTLAPGVAYDIFLQLPDGTVQSIPIAAGADAFHVTLANAPRLELALDNDLYARTTYQIAAEGPVSANAFLVGEKDPDDNFTYQIRAVNYSFLYYANDQLAVWLDFEQAYLDAGPLRRDGAAVGSSAIVVDGSRGRVHQGAGAGDRVNLEAFNAPASYTKAFWARRNSIAGAGSILSSTSTHERVVFGAASIDVLHSGALAASADWPGAAGEWHHAAVSYDADGSFMAVYIDGRLAAAQDGVAQRETLSSLHAVGYNGGDGLAGAIDDLRLYTRALSAPEVWDLYLGSKL